MKMSAFILGLHDPVSLVAPTTKYVREKFVSHSLEKAQHLPVCGRFTERTQGITHTWHITVVCKGFISKEVSPVHIKGNVSVTGATITHYTKMKSYISRLTSLICMSSSVHILHCKIRALTAKNLIAASE